VATGGFRSIIERCLSNLLIRDLFQAIVSAEDVQHHKPAPDTYLRAAELLKLDPRDCCAFEDTDIGLRAARDAGMSVVDVRRLIQA
jgi:HAD superfamily hydrolase (TIGR01509 family)